MANLNKRAREVDSFNPTLNNEGAFVHRLNPLEELFSKVLGSFFGESTFYRDKSPESEFEALVKLIESVPEEDKEYVLKIALLGRNWNMISFPLSILTACFNMERYKGKNFLDGSNKNKLSAYSRGIVRRAKDINEILASHFAVYGNGGTLPKQMRISLRDKLESFDKHRLSMGLNKTSETKLADAIKVLHPRPKNEEMKKFYKDVIENRVKLGEGNRQVRSILSDIGKQEKKDTSELKDSLKTNTLFTIVNNLINFYKNGIFSSKEDLDLVIGRLSNKEEVLRSKMLPFRFYSAYNVVSSKINDIEIREKLKDALTVALDFSIDNLTPIEGKTAILVDVSGSMTFGHVSSYSEVTYLDIALLLGAIAYKKGYGDMFTFASEPRKLLISRNAPVFDIIEHAKSLPNFNGGTDLYKAFSFIEDYCVKNGVSYDNLIMLSDSDCYGYNSYDRDEGFSFLSGGYYWTSGSSTYQKADDQVDSLLSKGVFSKIWLNDLSGNDYAVVNTNSNRKNLITGFSEKFIEMINIYNNLGSNKDIRPVIDELLNKSQNRKRA